MHTKYLHNQPLTQSQKLIWMGQKMNPNVPLYNVPYAFEIKGNISEEVFELAIQALIERTETYYFFRGKRNSHPESTYWIFFPIRKTGFYPEY